MIFTLVGLSLLWLAGFQMFRLLSSALNAEINVWLQAGAGFFMASALLILWLTSASLSLSSASWGAVGISTLVSLPLFLQRPQLNPFCLHNPYIIPLMASVAKAQGTLAN